MYFCLNFVDNIQKDLKRQQIDAKRQFFHVNDLKIHLPKNILFWKESVRSFQMANWSVFLTCIFYLSNHISLYITYYLSILYIYLLNYFRCTMEILGYYVCSQFLCFLASFCHHILYYYAYSWRFRSSNCFK